MKLKVFTLCFDPAVGGFDDTVLQDFLKERQVLNVHEHFFMHDQSPMWALLVSYRDEEQAGDGPRKKDKGKNWRADLSQEERSLYDALRTWRNDRAGRDGRPPYILLTNKQMALIAQKRPKNLEALREIEGVGEAKVEAFGRDLVALIASRPDEDIEMKEASTPKDGQENGS